MNLFGIAIKNIKRNLNSYFLYFVSMVFSIMIFFTFSTIQYNKLILDLTSTYLKVNTAFSVCSVIIAVFTAFFIWYSNSFFTTKRKKEVGLYCLMGVKRGQIARMLFYENLVMGILALLGGILAGSLFSRLFVMILLKLMGIEVALDFYIPLEAVMNTVFVYLILFFLTALHGYSLIYRFQLVELFKSEKEGQKPPETSLALALLSVLLIGTGYYLALNFRESGPVNFLVLSMVILVVTVLGTYMFFSSLVFYVVKLAKKFRARFYRGLNIIGTSNLLFRIRSNSKLLATIAVLSATTLTAMSGALAFYHDQLGGMQKTYPFSFVYQSKDSVLDQKIEQVISRYPQNKIKDTVEIEYVYAEANYPNLSTLIGKSTDYEKSSDNVISESTLKKVLNRRGIEYNSSLGDNEVLMYYYFMYSEKYMRNPVGKIMYYNIDGKEQPFTIKGCKDYPVINRLVLGSPSFVNVIVVSDPVYEKLSSNGTIIRLKAILIENQEKSKDAAREVARSLAKSKLYGGGAVPLSTFYDSYSEMMYKMGTLVFLAFFAGMVFLICTGSMIFFKQLSEANQDKERYDILKKIGISRSEINTSIAKQMLFIFGLPLLVGVSHSIVAIQILQPFIKISILYPTLCTIGIYTIVYLVYYFLTVSYYGKIVNGSW